MNYVSSFPSCNNVKNAVVAVLLSVSAASIYAVPDTGVTIRYGLNDVVSALENEEWSLARNRAESLIKSMPGDATLHYYLAQIYAAQEEWGLAKRMLDKAKYFDWQWKFASSKDKVSTLDIYIVSHLKPIALNESHRGRSNATLADVENALKEHNTEQALTIALSLVKKIPGNAKLHYYLAQIYADQSKWEDAHRMLEKAKYFDWQWKFATSKSKVAELDTYINLRLSTQHVTSDEIHSIFRKTERLTRDSLLQKASKPSSPLVILTDMSRPNFFLFLASVVFLLGGVVMRTIYRENFELEKEQRQSNAELCEKKIVLTHLVRIIEDLKFTAEIENFTLLSKALENLQLQISMVLASDLSVNNTTVAEIESLVSLTKLYKHHSDNIIELKFS